MADNQTQKTEWIHCNDCLHKTKHSVITELSHEITEASGYEHYDFQWEIKHTLLVCCGCKFVTLRRIYMFSEWDSDEAEVSFYPPPVSRQLPNWHYDLPDEMQELLSEIYTALHSNSRRLALMGTRTIIDVFATDKIGDIGNFQKKMETLVEKGYLSCQQKTVLDIALEAGNAAAHRCYKPSPEILSHVIDVVENLVQSYALAKASSSGKVKIPSRSKPSKAVETI